MDKSDKHDSARDSGDTAGEKWAHSAGIPPSFGRRHGKNAV